MASPRYEQPEPRQRGGGQLQTAQAQEADRHPPVPLQTVRIESAQPFPRLAREIAQSCRPRGSARRSRARAHTVCGGYCRARPGARRPRTRRTATGGEGRRGPAREGRVPARAQPCGRLGGVHPTPASCAVPEAHTARRFFPAHPWRAHARRARPLPPLPAAPTCAQLRAAQWRGGRSQLQREPGQQRPGRRGAAHRPGQHPRQAPPDRRPGG